MVGVDIERLDAVLAHVIHELRRPETDLTWSSFISVEEGVGEIQEHRARLARGDVSQVRWLATLFVPTGAIQEAAVSSGWGAPVRWRIAVARQGAGDGDWIELAAVVVKIPAGGVAEVVLVVP